MKTQNLLLKDVAALAQVKPYQITYAISVGLLPEPELRFANKRVFQPKELQAILAYFKDKQGGGHV